MTTIPDVEDFLALKRIAMVGVSRDPKDFSRHLFREMCSRGYDMVPVNWVANEIDDRESFQCLQAIKPAVQGALIMTPARETLRVVRDCAESGIEKVWIYRAGGTGAVSEEAIAFCKENGIQAVEGHCPFMFFLGAGFPHRVHGFFLKLTHHYPAGGGVRLKTGVRSPANATDEDAVEYCPHFPRASTRNREHPQFLHKPPRVFA